MAKDIEKYENENENENLPTENSSNPYEDFGNQTSGSNIVGQLLKFIKGEWSAGQEGEPIEIGTRLIVDMRTLMTGWTKWSEQKPVEHIMGLVVDRFQPPPREDLGEWNEDSKDHSTDAWELDDNNVLRDPWQFTNMVVMKSPDDDSVFTFSTSSVGGKTAIGTLCKTYGRKIREEPDVLPIIELRETSYKHSNKQRGTIHVPVFKIVDWVSAADVVYDDPSNDNEPKDEIEDEIEDIEDEIDEEVDEDTGEVTEKSSKTRQTSKPASKPASRSASKPAPKKVETKSSSKKVDPKAKKKTRF